MKKIGTHYRILVLMAVFSFLAGGCGSFSTVKSLDKTKDLSGKGDYASVARLKIDCDASCDGCNQLHLLKGDACYRLAKNGQEPMKQYQCAATELTEGIQMTSQWQNLNRPRTYTNLCEALRNLRDLSSGQQADGINDQLLKTTQSFLSAEQGNACGVYFQTNAQFAKKRNCLLHPEQCPAVCSDLNAMLQSLADASTRAGGIGCEAELQQMTKDVNGVKGAVNCR
jgi:hypothetical protein